jgi:hypothetical protein
MHEHQSISDKPKSLYLPSNRRERQRGSEGVVPGASPSSEAHTGREAGARYERKRARKETRSGTDTETLKRNLNRNQTRADTGAAGGRTTMNLLRAFAELDSSKSPHLSSLVRYEGISVFGMVSPGSPFGGNRVGCVPAGGQSSATNDTQYDASAGGNTKRNHHAENIRGGIDLDVFVASGRDVYAVRCPGDDAAGKALERGKGGHVYLPSSGGAVVGRDVISALSLRAEIQSLSISGNRILVTDVYGRGICGWIGRASGERGGDTSTRIVVEHAYPLHPNDSAVCLEGGLTVSSVAEGSMNNNLAVIARHFPKDVTVFDKDVAVRTLHTLHNPNNIKIVDNNLVAVAEGSMVTVYDTRIADRQTRVARLQPVGSAASGSMYALAASSSGGFSLLGAGGEDRDVFVWDPRVWKSVNQWKNCVKYELTSLHFLDSDPRYCVVGGMDYEVACGAWFENKSKAFRANIDKSMSGLVKPRGASVGRATGPVTEAGSVAEAQRQSRVVASYRGTSRWIGMSKLEGKDIFVGVTTDGKLYRSAFA